MANLTKNEKYIVDMYVRYFGKAPSVAEIAKYNDFKTPKLILKEIIGDADDSKATLTTKEFVNNAFQNLFGRDATTKEMNKYSKVVDAGKDLPINAIVKSAKKADKGVYEAKKAIAIMLAEDENTTNYNLDKITKDTYADVYDLKTKKLLVDSVAQLETKIDAMPDNVPGKTFNLTTSIDTLVGSDKGDLFEGIVDTTNSTLTALDSIDGKEGKDTLNILNAKAAALELPAGLVVKNVEIVNVKSAHDVGVTGAGKSFDVSGFTGLTDLNITQAKDVFLTAAATTDVNVSGTTGAIVVKGGNDVVVTDSKAGSTITVGDTAVGGVDATGTITITDTDNSGANAIIVEGGTDVTVTTTADKASSGAITIGHATNGMATGNVVVTQNTTSNGTATTAGSVNVTGGKTVEITANMTNTAVKGGGTGVITAGTYTVTADNTTTNVTITQNATAIDFKNDAAAGTAEVSTVTFGSLKAGEKAIISAGALTGAGTDLTFTASKDLTAEQVAAAFANLTAADTQSATGITANGYFSGDLDTGWTSGAVSGSSVTFTATTVGNQANEITVSAKLANGTTDTANVADFKIASKTDGTAAGASTAVNVTEDFGDVVVDDNATKSITTITLDGFDNAALGAAAAGSLDKLATLNLTNGQGTGTGTVLTSTVATLNVTLNDMAGTVDLDGATATTLKTLNLTTTGEASTIILDADAVETLTIAAAADLDISNGGTNLAALKTATITGARDVNLGDLSASASFATLNASAAKGDITAEITATNTAVTTGSGNDTITATVGAVGTAISKAIDLGAGDDTLVLFDDTTAVPTAAVKGGDGVDTISMTFTSADSYDNTELFKNAISGFERLEINNSFLDITTTQETLILDMEKLGFNYVITNGTGIATLQDRISLTNLAANATVELNANGLVIAALKTATGTADVMNVVTNVTTSAVDFGTFTVASVETVNIKANDTQLDDNSDDVIDSTNDIVEVATLNLTADAAKTVNVAGTSSLTLDTVSTTITKVDASAMTGDLVYTADGATAGTEVIGGAGNDTLRASGEKDVLKGGAGNDTFYATDLTTVHGGAGADKFYFATPTQLSKVSTIADLGSGDTIYLQDEGAVVGKFFAAGAQYNANTTTTFEAKVNASLVQTGAGEATWFQHGGNTYIVIDGNDGANPAAGAVDSYTAGQDTVIEITGTVNLSTASFNATTGSLEIA